MEVFGRLSVSAYSNREGKPTGSLNCHVNHFNMYDKGSESETPSPAKNNSGKKTATPAVAEDVAGDLPF